MEIALSKGVPQEEAGNIVSDVLAASVQGLAPPPPPKEVDDLDLE